MSHMKKYVAICGTLVALTWVGVAAAATPQGKLTGSASVNGLAVTITTTITDGGTSFVGLENDKSGNCAGDSGVITIGRTAMDVPCAHYVASSRDGSGAKMRFAYEESPGGYIPARITDSPSGDTFKIDLPAAEVTLAQAQAWVDLGLVGSGSSPSFSWQLLSMTSSTFSITP
jgi:hypothetical protein